MKNVSIVKVIMMIIILLLVGTVVVNSRTASEEAEIAFMNGRMAQCKEQIDSLENEISFMDTVGESDEYCNMMEAYQKYTETDNLETMFAYFDQYMDYYNKVMKMSLDLLKQKAVDNYKDSLPLHVCGRE